MIRRPQRQARRLPILLLVSLVSAAALASCTGSTGGTSTGNKPITGQNAPPGLGPEAVGMTPDEFEAAFDEFIGLKPKAKPQVFTKVTDAFPGSDQAKLSSAAESGGFMFAVSGDFEGSKLSYAGVDVLGFSKPGGADKVAKAWQDLAQASFVTIKPKKISGQLPGGTPYFGFSVSLLDGEQEIFVVAP